LAILLAVGSLSAVAGSVETYIKQLKDKNPAVRARAAHELGGG
jgi:HEAT repeat protein